MMYLLVPYVDCIMKVKKNSQGDYKYMGAGLGAQKTAQTEGSSTLAPRPNTSGSLEGMVSRIPVLLYQTPCTIYYIPYTLYLYIYIYIIYLYIYISIYHIPYAMYQILYTEDYIPYAMSMRSFGPPCLVPGYRLDDKFDPSWGRNATRGLQAHVATICWLPYPLGYLEATPMLTELP